MKIKLNENGHFDWKVRKIAVIGPGIVGMPMAALLARARISIGVSQPAEVVVVQRNSPNSGWKVGAINAGRSVIGGIEPELDGIVEEAVKEGLLSATHDYRQIADADVILVCVQTDKKPDSCEPDYGPLFGALDSLAAALREKPAGHVPLVIIESTLAPSTMNTLITDHFARYGLIEGQDILLGNSPNRVMPGRLVERISRSDKLVAGLRAGTPFLIRAIYRHIVTEGALHPTSSLAAEVVKTLENAYRDVRIAYASEIARYCNRHDIDFYALRDQVNQRLAQVDAASRDPNAVPSGGLLIPTAGVGGHCLPKDGALLCWRRAESGFDTADSLFLQARLINEESPAETIRLAERRFGRLGGKKVAILGTAYRFNSEDTRNAPALALARQLIEKGCRVTLHDPFVKPDDQNLLRTRLNRHFTRSLGCAVYDADYIFLATAHKDYLEGRGGIFDKALRLKGIVEACNLPVRIEAISRGIAFAGIGRGAKAPGEEFADFVYRGFRAVEKGVANEVFALTEFLNERFVPDEFGRVRFRDVRRLAASCNTGCLIPEPGPVEEVRPFRGFASRLVACAVRMYRGQPAAPVGK